MQSDARWGVVIGNAFSAFGVSPAASPSEFEAAYKKHIEQLKTLNSIGEELTAKQLEEIRARLTLNAELLYTATVVPSVWRTFREALPADRWQDMSLVSLIQTLAAVPRSTPCPHCCCQPQPSDPAPKRAPESLHELAGPGALYRCGRTEKLVLPTPDGRGEFKHNDVWRLIEPKEIRAPTLARAPTAIAVGENALLPASTACGMRERPLAITGPTAMHTVSPPRPRGPVQSDPGSDAPARPNVLERTKSVQDQLKAWGVAVPADEANLARLRAMVIEEAERRNVDTSSWKPHPSKFGRPLQPEGEAVARLDASPSSGGEEPGPHEQPKRAAGDEGSQDNGRKKRAKGAKVVDKDPDIVSEDEQDMKEGQQTFRTATFFSRKATDQWKLICKCFPDDAKAIQPLFDPKNNANVDPDYNAWTANRLTATIVLRAYERHWKMDPKRQTSNQARRWADYTNEELEEIAQGKKPLKKR